jgi:hypothetical protein
MRYRIATAPAARVLPTLDGPLAVTEGEVVIVAVVEDYERAVELMRQMTKERK